MFIDRGIIFLADTDIAEWGVLSVGMCLRHPTLIRLSIVDVAGSVFARTKRRTEFLGVLGAEAGRFSCVLMTPLRHHPTFWRVMMSAPKITFIGAGSGY